MQTQNYLSKRVIGQKEISDKSPSTAISQKFSRKVKVEVDFSNACDFVLEQTAIDHRTTTDPPSPPTMKRKLDENNEPAAKESQPTTKENAEKKASFSDFGLDPRLVQAIAQEQYREPTLVQAKAIPLALEGKDVLAKAKTGSGKTAAYLLPVLQAVLKRKQVSRSSFPAHK